MEAEEFDTALTDLETRVDRLRALYENWFRGYEKTEPAVARKDAERRVYALRKELPRNTALRFRYHQLYQRYTTLATYWQRTARQIEEGTHRLQHQRIKRRRVDERPDRAGRPEARDSEAPRDRSYALDPDETLDVNKLLDDLDMDEVARAIDGPAPAPANTNVEKPRPAAARFARPSLASGEQPVRGSLPVERAPEQAAVASAGASGPPTGQVTLPPRIQIPGAPATGQGPLAPRPSLPSVGAPTGTRPSLSGPPTGQIPLPPRPSLPVAGAPTGMRPSLPGSPSLGPPKPPLKVPAPTPSLAPGAAKPGVPPPPPPAPGRAGPPPVVPRPPPPAPSAPASGMSDQQMRRIYDEYAAARRRNNEGDVRFETLASSIQKMLPDLSKKHQGKQIDFEVVLKDGRVGLKPKAK